MQWQVPSFGVHFSANLPLGLLRLASAPWALLAHKRLISCSDQAHEGVIFLAFFLWGKHFTIATRDKPEVRGISHMRGLLGPDESATKQLELVHNRIHLQDNSQQMKQCSVSYEPGEMFNGPSSSKLDNQ